ncbi:MAG TPA: hypothetical protein VFA44_09765 [Gaiellaceae bacterium]|nr:hypothetical protein [Gaiellaceae bacterium]
MTSAPAYAKLNLALVVGPLRADGKHELATVYQRIDLADRVALEPGDRLEVTGFEGDTLVAAALRLLAAAAGVEPRWRVRLEKAIPVAAGLAGGSSDAAAALRLANDLLDRPLGRVELRSLAAAVGSDVPFFLAPGPQLGTGDGTQLEPLDLPLDYRVLLVLPAGAEKPSTAAVYASFDRRRGERGFHARRQELLGRLAAVRRASDLAALPRNDLARSPLAAELERLGAFRADVSGAGPTVYGLFEREEDAAAAQRALQGLGRTWTCAPAWYG